MRGMAPARLLVKTYVAFNARDIDGALEDGLVRAMEIRKSE